MRSLAGLCDSGAHPFKNWLDRVRVAYRAKDLSALSTRAGMAGPSPDSHLQRCSRGEMLTAETIREVTALLAQPKLLRDMGMQSRALAFAIDFMVAADAGSRALAWEEAQAIVKARIVQIGSDLQLSFATGLRRAPVSQ